MGCTLLRSRWECLWCIHSICGHLTWILWQNNFGSSHLADKILFVLNLLLQIIKWWTICNTNCGYLTPLEMDSIIGFDQLDETSSTLSSSIDPIPIVVFSYQLWSSYICYDFIYHLPSFRVYFARKPLADTMIIVS